MRRTMSTNSAQEWRNYFLSTHFWGPMANWGIPIAALADTQKHPKFISGKMTLGKATHIQPACFAKNFPLEITICALTD